MKVLAIESGVDNKFLSNPEKYLEENHKFIEQLYKSGKIQICWSSTEKTGNVLIINTDSIEEAKTLLKTSPLVKNKILKYTLIPLQDYKFDKSFSEEKNNFVLIYASAQVNGLDSSELMKILETSRKRNPKLDITGILLYTNGSFLQVLEGERKKVESLFKKIQTDSRHNKVVKITTYTTSKRLFSNWSMGYANISQEEIESIPGLNDFFKDGNSLTNIKEEQAKKILSAFKSGKWRQNIS